MHSASADSQLILSNSSVGNALDQLQEFLGPFGPERVCCGTPNGLEKVSESLLEAFVRQTFLVGALQEILFRLGLFGPEGLDRLLYLVGAGLSAPVASFKDFGDCFE